jgi:hypothetical protein
MATCTDCANFFLVPEGEDDFAPGNGDCVIEHKDHKGKYWLSKPTTDKTDKCGSYRQRS